MLDWRQLVSERLSGLELDGADREDVCAELAAHLEEDYLCALTAGASEQAALRRALRHVRDWHELQQQIESARKRELPMNKRVSQFWLPAFLTILFAMSTLMLIQLFGPSPVVDPLIWRSNRWRTIAPVAVVYVPWLLTLPFIGAIGAYVSARGEASRTAMLSSIVFPVLPYLAFFLVGLPITVILDDRVAHNITIPTFFIGLAAWVILPAIGLLAGGVPVHLWKRSGSRAVAHP